MVLCVGLQSFDASPSLFWLDPILSLPIYGLLPSMLSSSLSLSLTAVGMLSFFHVSFLCIVHILCFCFMDIIIGGRINLRDSVTFSPLWWSCLHRIVIFPG